VNGNRVRVKRNGQTINLSPLVSLNEEALDVGRFVNDVKVKRRKTYRFGITHYFSCNLSLQSQNEFHNFISSFFFENETCCSSAPCTIFMEDELEGLEKIKRTEKIS
jgi:hypothetical protein